MQKTATFTSALKTYGSLTKPGIILGNVITAAGGFVLASKGHYDFSLLSVTLIALSLIIASACVFNNYIDRDFDEKMTRTQHRALVRRLISQKQAVIFAIFLGGLGISFFAMFINFLTLAIVCFGFFVYIVLYSFAKYRSTHATLIGSIAGATPPVVGYCAVSNQFDVGALLFFTMVALWQMPHFFAIAIYRLEDYARASIPVLPVKKGIYITRIQMLFYISAFIVVSSLLTFLNYTGLIYLFMTAVLGTIWLLLCIQGFNSDQDQQWARKMFFFSLIVITTLCFVIPFSTINV